VLRHYPQDFSRALTHPVSPDRPWRAPCTVVLAALLTLALTAGAAPAAEMPAPEQPPPAYLGSAACADCHAGAAEAWSTSDHALAWTLPSEATLLGDFDDTVFEHGGQTTRFFREDGGFFIETEGPDGQRRAYPVVGVAGIDPLQQYLLSPEPGRTQAYDIAWDMTGGRWYPVFSGDPPPPGDGFHWTGPYKSWEARCAECHATGYTRNYAPATRTYAPKMAEIGVGCEACHGPGAAHIAWAAAPDSWTRPAGLTDHGLTVDLAASAGTEIEQCATCHSRREPHADGNPVPGTPYHDAFTLALLRDGLYHADGAILDEVFEMGSFLQSKMYARGVRCSTCHEPHSATLRAEGNAVCTQCHAPAGNPGFPTLRPALYDDPAHHFHEPGTAGAECRSCHMLPRTYMGVDLRYDHGFRIPRPDLAAETGAPDACTSCHADRDAPWAAAEVASRFPDSGRRGPHPSTIIAAARWSPEAQAGDLLSLATDREAAGILRATALDLLATVADPTIADHAAPLLIDPDPLVRAAAATLQRGLPPEARAVRLVPALDDPLQAVRIAAAKALLGAPTAADPATAAAQARAGNEWRASLYARSDFPETHLQIAGAALTTRDWAFAVRAFREAVSLDPQLVEAWIMIARIEAALGDVAAARRTVDDALVANPDNPELVSAKVEINGR
jgi:predicted CXXCH cytochrome family protein